MSGWMILWTTLIAGGFLGLAGMLLFITVGAFRELRESFADMTDSDPK